VGVKNINMDNNIIDVDEKELVEYIVKSLVEDNERRNSELKEVYGYPFIDDLRNKQYSKEELMNRLILAQAREEVYKYRYEQLLKKYNDLCKTN
jgi:hypothetical protein